jgi:hypothetical protein
MQTNTHYVVVNVSVADPQTILHWIQIKIMLYVNFCPNCFCLKMAYTRFIYEQKS